MTPLPPPWRPECRRVAEVLQAYLDGELSTDQTDLVAEHLRHCRRCGIDERVYRDVRRVLRGLASEPDPEAVARLRDYAAHLSRDQADGDS